MKNRTEEEDRWSTNYVRQLLFIRDFFSQIGCAHIQVNRACAFERLKRTRVEEGKQIDAKKKNECETRTRENEKRIEGRENEGK